MQLVTWMIMGSFFLISNLLQSIYTSRPLQPLDQVSSICLSTLGKISSCLQVRIKLSVVFKKQGDESIEHSGAKSPAIHNEAMRLQFISLDTPPASPSLRTAHSLLSNTPVLASISPSTHCNLLLVSKDFRRQDIYKGIIMAITGTLQKETRKA